MSSTINATTSVISSTNNATKFESASTTTSPT
jgi:hypothetical protein